MPPLAPQAAVHRSDNITEFSKLESVRETLYLYTLGGEGRFYCADGSDQAHCDGRVFTGCLRLTGLGLTISPCSACLCNLTSSVTGEAYAGQFLIPSFQMSYFC